MKLNKNFILKNIGSEYILIPLGQEAIEIKGLLKTNEVGSDIYKYIEKGYDVDRIIDAIVSDYGIAWEVAKNDVNEFISNLRKYGVISDEA